MFFSSPINTGKCLAREKSKAEWIHKNHSYETGTEASKARK